jgi:muconolactone delta-isomerase
MSKRTRRDFLADVGKGMAVAGLGSAVAADLGLSAAFAGEEPATLSFGRDLDPLVNLLQDTPPARLLPILVRRLRDGTELRQLVAAAALANARTFGGTDYVGFHTMMAISPSYHMAQELPADRRALPVLKVLYRNSNRIHERPNPAVQVLRQVAPAELPADRVAGELLRERVRARDLQAAERTFMAAANRSAEDAFNAVLFAVEDAADVHRVVMPYRAWDLMGVIGREQAHVLLRQSVRYCVQSENPQLVQHLGSVRTLVPRLLDEHRLLGRPRGTRQPDDAWVEQMSRTIFEGTPERAAEAVAAALAEGMVPEAIGEAITLAANQLVLRDNGRPQNQSAPNRPAGSVHGDSIGVHGCDSANAWRNMARVSNDRNRVV